MSKVARSRTAADEHLPTNCYRQRVFGITQTTFLIASIASHAAIFLYFLAHKPSDKGAESQVTEAISVELALSSIIEAAQIDQTKVRESASVATLQESPPELAQPTPATIVAEDAPEDNISTSAHENIVSANEPLDIISTTDEQPIVDQHNATREISDKPVVSKLMMRKRKKSELLTSPRTHRPKEDTKQQTSTSHNSNSSSASSRSSNRNTASSGRISASKGDLVSYAARVRAQVASRRPAGHGVRGTVVIAFSVARSGALGAARISSSSGNATIDRATLLAVLSAGPFPPPPGGTGPITFAVPFHYR